jgi:ankyrin repeat protein
MNNYNISENESLTQEKKIQKRKISESSSSSDSEDEKEKNNSIFQNINFPVIVDIFSEVRNSNYLPMLKLLKKSETDETIDITKKDEFGYNIFHYVIISGNFSIFRSIAKFYPKFLKEKSSTKQSNLMIALNQPSFDMVNFLLKDQNSDLDENDDYGFDVFFYLIKNNSIPMFFYFHDFYMKKAEKELIEELVEIKDNFLIKLLFQKSPFTTMKKTKIGSTILHWAAYKDSEFFMKIFFRFNLDFFVKDNDGITPIERASENNSFKVIVFFDEFSKYPFQTNFFLYNIHKPVEFDFLPDNLATIEKNYESPNLKENFLFKKNKKFFFLKSVNYFYSKYNLQFKFGLVLYTLWTLISTVFIMPHVFQTKLEIFYQVIYFFFRTVTFFYSLWFYK